MIRFLGRFNKIPEPLRGFTVFFVFPTQLSKLASGENKKSLALRAQGFY